MVTLSRVVFNVTDAYISIHAFFVSSLISAQTLDSSELEGDGIVLSLEEQLNALSLSSSPSPSCPETKDTVALNGTRFSSQLFEETSESTKVGRESNVMMDSSLQPPSDNIVKWLYCIEYVVSEGHSFESIQYLVSCLLKFVFLCAEVSYKSESVLTFLF